MIIPPPCKAYSAHNTTHLVAPNGSYSFLQKLLYTVFLMVLWSAYLLFAIGFSCKTQHHVSSKDKQSDYQTFGLSDYTTYIVGSITILDMDDLVTYPIIGYSSPKSKWKHLPSKEPLLSGGKSHNLLKGSQSICQPMADHGNQPNWAAYGVTPSMLCQRSSFSDNHTFTLGLDSTKFQNDTQLGFILVKNNGSPGDLVKHLLEASVPWPDPHQACKSIKDYLILPGIIKQGLLESEYHIDGSIDLNSYSNSYCYIKKDHHYCFIPLKNSTTTATNYYSVPTSLDYNTPKTSEQAASPPLESSVDRLPTNELPLQQSESLDALPMINGPLAETGPISTVVVNI